MEWWVGMDLSDRGQGALGYASWLSRTLSSGEEADRFSGVHVLEEAELQPLLRYHHLGELEKNAQNAADKVIAKIDEGLSLSERRIVCGRTAERVLADLAKGEGVRGLIIGRQAKRGEKRIVRLGRVARRLLRSLTAPTIVVPPDLRPAGVGSGPVLLAASIESDATEAATFARQIAQDLGRPLTVVHVVPGADYLAGEMVPAGVTGELFRELRENHERRLGIWMRTHGLSDVPQQVVEGSVVDRLAELAKAEDSPLIVCGSRGLGLGLRLFTSSVASDLAAACDVAVAVVPNGDR